MRGAGMSCQRLVAGFARHHVDDCKALVLAYAPHAVSGFSWLTETMKRLPYARTASYSACVGDTRSRQAGSPHSQRSSSRTDASRQLRRSYARWPRWHHGSGTAGHPHATREGRSRPGASFRMCDSRHRNVPPRRAALPSPSSGLGKHRQPGVGANSTHGTSPAPLATTHLRACAIRARLPAMAPSEDAPAGPLAGDELRLVDAWWRAANYLSVGQIYLLGNALLREPLAPEHVKPRLLGHWGTTPGLNLIWAHLNRLIRRARPERAVRDRTRSRRPRHRGQRLPRGHLQRALRAGRSRRARDCSSSSASSRSRAASRATPRPRRPGRSTRAASSATRWLTPSERPSTTPT